ncbi:regulator of g protein signaling [Anaeramoeba flamelloides]|uniref:Regulator of g protein signaling n=1 Tax=Anaeramoeba flamelloides TaxID=1746091 RepID=A0AAV7ZV65_9EUKA|nr:regulator of g protein signaling [Anaeramoeba flamelloides]
MGNFKPRKKIKNRKKESYLKKLSKQSDAIAIVGVDGKFLFANKSCKKYFGFSGLEAKKKVMTDLKPQFQQHTKLDSIAYVAHEIKIANQLQKKQERRFRWYFQPYDELIQTSVQITLIEIENKLAIQALIKPDNRDPNTLIKTKSATSTGSIAFLEKIQSSESISSKPNSSQKDFSSILERIQKTNSTGKIKNMDFHKEQILVESKRIRVLQKENEKIGSIFSEFVRKRNITLEKLRLIQQQKSNQNLSETFQIVLEDRYDEEINQAVSKIQKFNVLDNTLSSIDLNNENYLDSLLDTLDLECIIRVQNVMAEKLLLHRDMLRLKIQFIEQQIKRINLEISFFKMQQRITNYNEHVKEIANQSIDNLIEFEKTSIVNDKNTDQKKTEEQEKKSVLNVLKRFDITIDLNLIPFDLLVTKKKYSKFFMNFLKSQFTEENLLFFDKVNTFKKIKKKDELKNEAKNIYGKFIEEGAKMQINIDSVTRNNIITKVKSNNINSDIFEQAQNQIYFLMLNDPYSRFLDSPDYEELKKTNPTFEWKK